MKPAGFPDDEDARLTALRRYTILDIEEEEAFDRITSIVQAVLEVPMAAVSLVDLDRQWFRAAKGFDVGEMPRQISFCSFAIASSAPLVVPEAAADPRFAKNPLVTGAPFVRAYAGVPLVTPDGFNVGVLCAIDTRPRPFSDRQVDLLANLARLVVDELELRQVATVDSLTGALLRRAFIKRVDRTVEERRPETAALAILDIDRFKTVNDTYGHAVGDQVLKGFAKHVMAWKRPADAFGRLGGEEFGLLMPDTDVVEALERMERLRSIIETMGVDAPVDVGVTASIGLAPLGDKVRTTGGWLHVADKALYEAKVFGRNKTVIGDPDSSPPPGEGRSPDRRRVRDLPTESEVISPLTVMRWVNNLH